MADVETRRDHAAFVQASVQLHYDLSCTSIVHDLKLSDVACGKPVQTSFSRTKELRRVSHCFLAASPSRLSTRSSSSVPFHASASLVFSALQIFLLVHSRVSFAWRRSGLRGTRIGSPRERCVCLALHNVHVVWLPHVASMLDPFPIVSFPRLLDAAACLASIHLRSFVRFHADGSHRFVRSYLRRACALAMIAWRSDLLLFFRFSFEWHRSFLRVPHRAFA